MANEVLNKNTLQTGGRPIDYVKDRIPQGVKVNVVELNADKSVDHSKAYEVEVTNSEGSPHVKKTTP